MNEDSTGDGLSEFSSLLERARSDEQHRRDDVEAMDAARRRRRRAVIAALLVVALTALGIGGYIAVLFAATPPAATAEVAPLSVAPAAPVAVTLPSEGAAAISMTGAETLTGAVPADPGGAGPILGAVGGDEARPIASITKLVTALVILEEHPLASGQDGPTLTFDEADSDLYDDYYLRGATVQPMTEGSALSERQVLELMLVASATNYSDAASRWAFGSDAAFRRAAADWLASRGLTGTTVVEPTGLDPANVSTPSDLVALGRIALENPVVAEIVASPSLTVPGIGPVSPTNALLGTPGVTGIKTGTLEEAGSCLLFSATIDVGAETPITLVGVVLAAVDRDSAAASARAMIDSVVAGFHEVPLIAEGDVVGRYITPWGGSSKIVAGSDAAVLTWSDTALSATLPPPPAVPIAAAREGAEVGSATFAAERGDTPASVPLILAEHIEGPDPWWRLLHPRQTLGLG